MRPSVEFDALNGADRLDEGPVQKQRSTATVGGTVKALLQGDDPATPEVETRELILQAAAYEARVWAAHKVRRRAVLTRTRTLTFTLIPTLTLTPSTGDRGFVSCVVDSPLFLERGHIDWLSSGAVSPVTHCLAGPAVHRPILCSPVGTARGQIHQILPLYPGHELWRPSPAQMSAGIRYFRNMLLAYVVLFAYSLVMFPGFLGDFVAYLLVSRAGVQPGAPFVVTITI